jgi:hypothetical protein
MTTSGVEQDRAKYRIDPSIRMRRGIESGTYYFMELFSGFENLDAVRQVFGNKTAQVLSKLKVEVFPRDGFMGVSDEDGHIFASQSYLNSGVEWSIYLDVVHELVHVRQFMEGKELFNQSYSYVDRPTEIEAYQVGAAEARRIGMDEKEIFEYLEVPWISKEEHERLALTCRIPEEIVRGEKALKRKKSGSTTK